MKSKRGIVITGIVLAAITAASFMVWMVPQSPPTRFVVSNAEEDLDALIEQQSLVSNSATEEFEKMVAGEITPQNYVNIAEIYHSQVNSFIIKILDSEIPQDWNPSYAAFLEHLRAYNSYLKESLVAANKLKDNPSSDISDERSKMEQLKEQAEEFLAESYSSRP